MKFVTCTFRSLPARTALVAVLALVVPAHAAPVLHERIPDDAKVDHALGAVVAGEIPAVVETPSGFLGAPDPRRPTSATESTYGAGKSSSVPGMQPDASYVPDRDTRRPDALSYDDPFTPSNAPFKRLVAFDSVKPDFSLTVTRPELRVLPRSSQVDSADDRFFADIVVEGQPGTPVRIPTVGPDSRVLHAHLAAGAKDVKFRLLRDEADNWFVDFQQPGRGRLVMDLAIRRATFGGELGRASWSELPRVPPLPLNVAQSAKIVAEKIGVSRDGMLPRDVITKLVSYYRAFKESDEPPKPGRDVFTDIALSQKGVCRHRAYAFLVTALSLGVPTRMIVNEAHAWVEVHDGRLWRRIDLGGAGRMLSEPLASKPVHETPVDPFGWPPNATRGEDIAGLPKPAPQSAPSGGAGGGAGGARSGQSADGPRGASSAGAMLQDGGVAPADSVGTSAREREREKDSRPPSNVTLTLESAVVLRGGPLKVKGAVAASKEPCAFVTVELVFKNAAREHRVGSLATDKNGEFSGSVTVPPAVAVGDYDLVARTEGDLRCGATR